MRIATDFNWTDAAGKRIDAPHLSMVAALKSSRDGRRATHRVRDGQRDLLLKTITHRSLRKRWAAARRKSVQDVEARMLALARERGLRAPQLIARGRRGHLISVRQQALLAEFLPDRIELFEHAGRRHRAGDTHAVAAARRAMVAFLAAIRNAGLTDRDFGAKHLLIAARHSDPADLVWVDLEAAAEAAPTDASATAAAAGAMIANWWVATEEDDTELRALVADTRELLPEPTGGWAACDDQLNEMVAYKMRKWKAREAIETEPERVSLAG